MSSYRNKLLPPIISSKVLSPTQNTLSGPKPNSILSGFYRYHLNENDRHYVPPAVNSFPNTQLKHESLLDSSSDKEKNKDIQLVVEEKNLYNDTLISMRQRNPSSKRGHNIKPSDLNTTLRHSKGPFASKSSESRLQKYKPPIDNVLKTKRGELKILDPERNQSMFEIRRVFGYIDPAHEMKKQILSELMERNKIPANYFLLGKQNFYSNIELDVGTVANLVDISSNKDGDIVIKPIERVQIQNKIKELATDNVNQLLGKMIETPKKKKVKRMIGKFLEAKVKGYVELKHNLEPIPKVGWKRELIKHNSAKSKESIKFKLEDLAYKDMNKDIKMLSIQKVIPVSSIKEKKTVIEPEHIQDRINRPLRKFITRAISPIKHSSFIKHKSRTQCYTKAASPKKRTNKRNIQLPINQSEELNNKSLSPKVKDHLYDHPVNVLFREINEILMLVRQKVVSEGNFIKLCKRFDIHFTKKQLENEEFFKVRENIVSVKEKLLHAFYNELNKENEYVAEVIKIPKYFLGKGNNPMLVQTLIKQRWWNKADSIYTANLIWTQWKKRKIINLLPVKKELTEDVEENKKRGILRLYNHVEGNGHLANKKAMFYNMKAYYESIGKDPFKVLPITFHIKEGKNDKEYQKFIEEYEKNKEHTENIWIIKPGENTNRGRGITIIRSICGLDKILIDTNKRHTYIVQKYIERPLLFNKRKFDIRCYGLLTAINNNVKGYFCNEGYLRTASKDYSLKCIGSKIVHLTNEAVQMNYEEFGKFEPGNKVTYYDFQKYLDITYPENKINFFSDILLQIKRLVTDSFRATHGKLDPAGRQYTFELFGYDFMIDNAFHVYLIEVNTNPCLEIMSPITAKIVPIMVDSALRIAVDPLFQPPADFFSSKKYAGEVFPEIKHELVYDSKIDAPTLQDINNETIILEAEENNSDEDAM